MNKMLEINGISTSDEGQLVMGGVNLIQLAKELRTPLYVMDEGRIRNNCKSINRAITSHYPYGHLACYASKAFCCKHMCRIAKEEGMGLDVVSGGELFTALSVDFPTDKICFHGSNKTKEELIMAITHGVGRIVVDNLYELEMLEELTKKHNKSASLMIRLKPGIDAHTHEFIQTGQLDSRFGFGLETGEAMDAVKRIAQNPLFKLRGIHCHIGSQISETKPFAAAAKVLVEFLSDIKSQLGLTGLELNLGGGFSIRYTEDDTPLTYDDVMKVISKQILDSAQEAGLEPPFLLLEPGRSIVGDAGLTLYTVGSIKRIPGIRTYVMVDGGLVDNPRYALYDAKYTAVCANHADKEPTETVTIAGRTCESSDLIGKDMLLQPVQPGDLIAVLSTGAYNYSMALTYNRLPCPAVVMVDKGKAKIAVKRSSFEDVMRNDT